VVMQLGCVVDFEFVLELCLIVIDEDVLCRLKVTCGIVYIEVIEVDDC